MCVLLKFLLVIVANTTTLFIYLHTCFIINVMLKMLLKRATNDDKSKYNGAKFKLRKIFRSEIIRLTSLVFSNLAYNEL